MNVLICGCKSVTRLLADLFTVSSILESAAERDPLTMETSTILRCFCWRSVSLLCEKILLLAAAVRSRKTFSITRLARIFVALLS